jgi:hypothetical protein
VAKLPDGPGWVWEIKLECAGINRREVANARVVRVRRNEPTWPVRFPESHPDRSPALEDSKIRERFFESVAQFQFGRRSTNRRYASDQAIG